MARANLIVPEHYIKPKCEAEVSQESTRYNKIKGYQNPNRCRNQASVHIDGKNLCRKHASMVALDILLNEEN